MTEPCANCGGDCAPECGFHPLGCIYGGSTEASSYWLANEDCTLNHDGPLAPILARFEDATR